MTKKIATLGVAGLLAVIVLVLMLAQIMGPKRGDRQFGSRTYTLRLSQRSMVGKLPLVIALHGAGMTGLEMEKMTGLTPVALKNGMAVVYPDGSGSLFSRGFTWNADTCCGFASANQIDDLAYLEGLIDELSRTYPINSQAIFVTGISNGAMMAQKLAADGHGKVRAFASVAGTLNQEPVKTPSLCAALLIHGDKDRSVPINGGPRSSGRGQKRFDIGQDEAFKFWMNVNGISKEGKTETKGPATITTVESDQGIRVEKVVINGGRHSWPGAKFRPSAGDPIEPNFDASTYIIDFFKPQVPRD